MKKMYVMLMALLAGGMMMMSCGSAKKSVSIADLAGEWEIVEVNDKSVSAEETPFLEMAMADIKAAKTLSALMDVWNSYPALQSDKDFVSAMTAKKTFLKNNA